MKRILITFLVFLPLILFAQKWGDKPCSVSILNNATMLPPASLTAVFNQPVHPGIIISTEFGWKENAGGKWFQNASLGYIYHELANQSFLLFTQGGYRKYISKFTLEGSLQAGYMHCLSLVDRIIQDDNDKYKESKGIGKPQFIFGAGTSVGYRFEPSLRIKRIFLSYDIRMQLPFVKSYVTMLPNGALSLGCQFTLGN
jgi:hypothetical protein